MILTSQVLDLGPKSLALILERLGLGLVTYVLGLGLGSQHPSFCLYH